MTENEKIWQWLEAHRQEFLDYWAAKLKDASEVERIAYDPERLKGVLMSFDYQGVRKLVAVSPDDLLEYTSGLDEEVRRRCITAAETAEDAASEAGSQARYAKGQGDRVIQAMDDLEELEDDVISSGDEANRQALFAKTQGDRAKEYNDHPWVIGNDGFIYVWNENTGSMIKTNKMIISFNDLTESQRQSMIDQFYAGLVFASKETCEAIVEELT